MSDMRVAPAELKRSVRLLDLVTLGAGTAIGASIFSILGPASKVAGSGVLVATLLAALPMSVFGTVYAFMSSAWPRSGASYEWQRTFVHPFLAFVVMWLRILGTSLILNVMGKVLISYLSEMTGLPMPGKSIVFAIFTAVFAINFIGVGVAARAQTLVMALLLASLTLFVVLSSPQVSLARVGAPFGGGIVPIVAALPLMIHLFMGIEACTEVGDEVEDAKRTIPLGLAFALLLCAVVYLAVAFTALGLVGPAALAASKAPLLTAAQAGVGRWASTLIGVAAVLALTKSMNAIFLVFSRLLFAMGRAGVFPQAFAYIHPLFGTPTVAIMAAYACAGACLLLPNGVVFLFLATTVPNMLKYFSTCLAALLMVRGRPDLHSAARLRLPAGAVRFLAIVGMGCAALIAVVGFGIDWTPYALLGAWLLLGLLYWFVRAARRKTGLPSA
jgi:APA family basic amino acid/polyamine antiporter